MQTHTGADTHMKPTSSRRYNAIIKGFGGFLTDVH